MSKIEVKNIYKIFGAHPKKWLQAAQGGMSKEELLAKSGHTLGLRDISLSIEEGSIYVIMGLSGSGKSTLIRHFNRLIEPSAGHILVDGVDVVSLNKRDLELFRQKKMSMVFQRFGLFPHRTVLDNAAYGLTVQGVGKAEREKRALINSPMVGFALWLRGSASAASSCEVLKMGVWAVIAVLLNSMSGADGADLLVPPDSPTTVA